MAKILITKAMLILKMYHRCFIWPETESNKVMTRLSCDLSQINNTQITFKHSARLTSRAFVL